jgi:hypothetical protein
MSSTISDLIKHFQIWLELIQSKDGPLLLQNFQIKYGFVENEIRNNFLYWNFLKFEIEFELKIKKALGFKNK